MEKFGTQNIQVFFFFKSNGKNWLSLLYKKHLNKGHSKPCFGFQLYWKPSDRRTGQQIGGQWKQTAAGSHFYHDSLHRLRELFLFHSIFLFSNFVDGSYQLCRRHADHNPCILKGKNLFSSTFSSSNNCPCMN